MRERFGNMNRRELLKLFGVSMGATLAGHGTWAREVQAQSRKVTPRKTARNCIFIQNCGAMSPPEVLDLKLTKYSAKDLEVVKVNSEWDIAKNLAPNYAVWAPRASLVRSFLGGPLVHLPAQYYTQAGRGLNPAIIREVPAFGSVIASELESERRESDTFPTYMSFDLWNVRCPQIGAGMLPPRFAGLDINTTNVFESFGGKDDNTATKSLLSERWEALERISEVSPLEAAALGDKAQEYEAHYQYAYALLKDQRFKKMLTVTDEDKTRYGVDKDRGLCKLGLELMLARNALVADAGARFIWVGNAYNGGNGVYDNHQNLYGRGALAPRGAQLSIYESVPRFDQALSALVQDLLKMPGHEPGKTMFDETLVVVAHEFGRTPEINNYGGRDHWAFAYTNLFIGGGVKPGRVIGKTDEYGAKVVDVGWKYKEQPMMDHVASTIYSALGIDYSKKIKDTPSGRAYEFQQTAPLGGPSFIPLAEIEELFV